MEAEFITSAAQIKSPLLCLSKNYTFHNHNCFNFSKLSNDKFSLHQSHIKPKTASVLMKSKWNLITPLTQILQGDVTYRFFSTALDFSFIIVRTQPIDTLHLLARQHSLRHFLPAGLVQTCFCGNGMWSCARGSSQGTRDHKHVYGWIMPLGRKSFGQRVQSQMSVTVQVSLDSFKFNVYYFHKAIALYAPFIYLKGCITFIYTEWNALKRSYSNYFIIPEFSSFFLRLQTVCSHVSCWC